MLKSPLRTSLLDIKYSDSVLATGLFQLVSGYYRHIFTSNATVKNTGSRRSVAVIGLARRGCLDCLQNDKNFIMVKEET